jgi:hypothetical protein
LALGSSASRHVQRLLEGIRVDDCQIPFAAELPIEAEIKNAASRAREFLADEQLLWLLQIARIAFRRGWLDEEAENELGLRDEDLKELCEALEFALDENVVDGRFNA